MHQFQDGISRITKQLANAESYASETGCALSDYRLTDETNNPLKFCIAIAVLSLTMLALPANGIGFCVTADSNTTPEGIGACATGVRNFWPTDGWQYSTPAEQGMNATKLDAMIDMIDNQDLAIDSIIIVRNGLVVLEEYPSGNYTPHMKHFLASCTKSIVSALIGLAVREGFLEGTEQKLLDLFSDRSIDNLDSRKENITIEHLLTMTAGFDWDEWSYEYDDPRNSATQMYSSADPVQYILDLPMRSNPGEEWTYCAGASHLLSAIIQLSTGMTTLNFANLYLFEPLGISNVRWLRDSQGIYRGSSRLSLTPRDMAKIGYLYLNEGFWDGKQILSTDWVARSGDDIVHLGGNTPEWSPEGYGYQWWTIPSLGVYYAAGARGQKICVFPVYNLVVVFTAYLNDPTHENVIITDMIISSIINVESRLMPSRCLGGYMLVAMTTPVLFAAIYWAVRTRRIEY